MPSAIVTGATGILGRQIVSELGKGTQQWQTIHALSRSKKGNYPSNVVHNHIDLQSSPDEMASDLKDIKGEYVFFAAYLQKDTEQENWDVNGALLSNFLTALEKTGAITTIKRIILVTGAKQYGVHLGAPKQPMLESDPWLTDSKWPPNFYYNQQNILHEYCAKHSKEWVVTYPNDVIGYAVGNFMNLSLAMALYVIVSKELSENESIVFPGSPTFYTKFDSFTSAKLHAEFVAWAALEPKAASQAFNVVNGDTETWLNLFPKVAEYFGARVRPDQFAGAGPFESSSMELAPEPPVSIYLDSLGLQGTSAIAPSKVEQHADLIKWSQRSDVKDAWNAIAEREGLDKQIFGKATWGFLGFVLGRNYDVVISMSKARACGWKGYEDTWESLEDVFGEMRREGVIPRT